jgi:hypothetical protein
MTPLAAGVFLELDRRANASIRLIDITANVTLAPISIISGTGGFRFGIMSIGRAAIAEDLVAAALEVTGETTAVGRSFTKHLFRGEFPGYATGTPQVNTANGLKILRNIISNPATRVVLRYHSRLKLVLELRVPGGAGARFSGNGAKFLGFIRN